MPVKKSTKSVVRWIIWDTDDGSTMNDTMYESLDDAKEAVKEETIDSDYGQDLEHLVICEITPVMKGENKELSWKNVDSWDD